MPKHVHLGTKPPSAMPCAISKASKFPMCGQKECAFIYFSLFTLTGIYFSLINILRTFSNLNTAKTITQIISPYSTKPHETMRDSNSISIRDISMKGHHSYLLTRYLILVGRLFQSSSE